MRRLATTVLFVLTLTGCGKFYWHQTGAGYGDFTKNHRECAYESALQATTTREYGVVSPKLFRRCMTSRGWTREQRPAPAPLNWLRGIEDEDLVRLDATPKQDWGRPVLDPG